MATNDEHVHLDDDGTSGEIRVGFHNRTIHRVLSDAAEEERPGIARDALEIGGEVLARLGHHGDLEQVANAVDQLDGEGKRIIDATVAAADKVVDDTVAKLTEQLSSEDGPLSGLLDQFDPTADGNVIEAFRDLVSSSIAKATKQAVADLAESTKEQVESLTASLTSLEKIAAIEEARLEEANRGSAKGTEHERDVESLLGELVAVAGDGLDDVSTVTGLEGNKKGDKVIRPRGGIRIVTEEKCTKAVTEAKARTLLDEAMRNRGAGLGMLVVEDDGKVPGNQPYHLIDDDKVVVAADPMTLRLVYCLMRSKAIEAAQVVRAIDDHAAVDALDAIRGHVAAVARALDRFKLIRTEHTKVTKAVSQASGYVDEIADSITDAANEISLLIEAVVGDDAQESAA